MQNQTSQVIGRTSGISTLSLAIANNSDRNGFVIQNASQTGVLFVKLGSPATISNYDYILSAGTTHQDGKGGTLSMTSGVVFMGPIYVASAGTTAYVAFNI